jgi:uncharacterized protein (TIGR02285 family)
MSIRFSNSKAVINPNKPRKNSKSQPVFAASNIVAISYYVSRIISTNFIYALPLLVCSLYAHANDEINWASPDWPPFYITNGPEKGLGVSQGFQFFFRDKLTAYQHHTAVMNFSRFIKEAEKGKHVCMVDLLKSPEREKVLYYSKPINLGIPQQVVMLKTTADTLLGKKNSVALVELMANKELLTIIEANRSYILLDPIIKASSAQENVSIAPLSTESLIGMLKKHRIDYFIEYPQAIRFLTDNSQAFRTINIVEQVPYMATYATCPKTPWGLTVIDNINAILKTQHKSKAYQRVFLAKGKYLDEKNNNKILELYHFFSEFH